MAEPARRLRPADDPAPLVPPHNLAAEESLLGGMLLSRDAIEAGFDVLGVNGASKFYRQAHGHVYQAAVAQWADGEPVDVVSTVEHLIRAGLLDSVGGPTALITLQTAAPSVANAARYARIVDELWLLRRGIEFAAVLSDACYSHPEDPRALLVAQEAALAELVAGAVPDDQLSTWDLFCAAYQRLERLRAEGRTVTGTPIGFVDIDELTGGLQPGTVVIVGARPAVGKTAFALNCVAHCVLHARRPAVVFSLEMSQLELANRLLSSEGRVASDRLRTGQLDDRDMDKLAEAMSHLSGAPLLIDDSGGTTVASMRAKCRKFKAQHGDLGLVVLDYVQLMQGEGGESRTQEIARISRALKMLARELDAPIMVLAQVSRQVESRQDKRPQNADLKDSGALEQDADVIMLLYRGEVYGDTQAAGIAEVHVSKHRAGATKTVKLAYLNHITRFTNMAITRESDPDPAVDESSYSPDDF